MSLILFVDKVPLAAAINDDKYSLIRKSLSTPSRTSRSSLHAISTIPSVPDYYSNTTGEWYLQDIFATHMYIANTFTREEQIDTKM